MTRKARIKRKLQSKLGSRKVRVVGLVLAAVMLLSGIGYIVVDYIGNKDETSSSAPTGPNQDNVEKVEITRPEKGTDGLPDPTLLIDDKYLSMELSDNGTYAKGERAKKVAYDGEARAVYTSDAGNTVTLSVIKDSDKKAWDDLRKHHPDAIDTGTNVENFDDAWWIVDSDLILRRDNLTIWLQFSFADRDQAMGVALVIGTNLQGLADRESIENQ